MIRTCLYRLRCCHPLSYSVMLLVGLLLVLITIPGQVHRFPHQDRLSWWEKQCKQVHDRTKKVFEEKHAENALSHVFQFPQLYEHGWPFPYLVRSSPKPLSGIFAYPKKPLLAPGHFLSEFWPSIQAGYVSWSNFDNWPFASVHWKLHPLHLAIDAFVFFAVIGTVGFVAERWLRNRGGLFRFRVVDLLAGLTVCALLLGWIAYHARLTHIEQQVTSYGASGSVPGNYRRITTRKKYSGPDWLQRLVGNVAYLPFLHHVYQASYHSGATWREDFDQTSKLPRLETLRLSLPVPFEAIQRLKASTQLQELDITANAADAETILKRYKLTKDSRVIRAENAEAFAVLNPSRITLRGRLFLPEDIKRLLSAASLERLYLHTPSITEAEMEKLRTRFPDTSINVWWGMSGPPTDNDSVTQSVRQEREASAHEP